MPAEIHIASLIVHVQPAQQTALRAMITGHGALELHADEADGKLIVVAEADDRPAVMALISLIEAQPGVLGCKMVYHEIVDESEIDQQLIPLVAATPQS